MKKRKNPSTDNMPVKTLENKLEKLDLSDNEDSTSLEGKKPAMINFELYDSDSDSDNEDMTLTLGKVIETEAE
jgi:hypothetical protein